MLLKIFAICWAVVIMLMVLLGWYQADHFDPDDRRKHWYDYAFDVATMLSVTGCLGMPFLM